MLLFLLYALAVKKSLVGVLIVYGIPFGLFMYPLGKALAGLKKIIAEENHQRQIAPEE